MSDTRALPGMESVIDGDAVDGRSAGRGSNAAAPRLRCADRRQMLMEAYCLDDLLPADHRARMVWSVVQRLDLSAFVNQIVARGSDPGRAATDPKILVSLWLYATLDNIGSARQLARLCADHVAYRWLCGGVSVNHHTLSDFRVADETRLDDLLTQVITTLVAEDVVKIDRISQDGLRVRAGAGTSSYRRRATLERLKKEVRQDIERLKRQREDPDDDRSARQRAAQQRAARERAQRIDKALALLPELEEIKTRPTGKPSKRREARVSTTDPQARRMKRGDGSIGPAYNLQFAADVESRAIVGVALTSEGDDRPQSEPMREQIAERTGRRVREHLYDGGYVKKKLIDAAASEEQPVTIYAPLPTNKDGQPCREGRRDTPAVRAWRQRMSSKEGKEVFTQRASTSETINADLSTHRALKSLNVRGPTKALCMGLWSALAYNLLHFGSMLIQS